MDTETTRTATTSQFETLATGYASSRPTKNTPDGIWISTTETNGHPFVFTARCENLLVASCPGRNCRYASDKRVKSGANLKAKFASRDAVERLDKRTPP